MIELLWWHWVVFGLILAVSEIFMPLFVVIWFGLSAIIVGIIDFGFDISLMSQLLIWLLLSIIFLTIWFIFLRDKSITKSGQSNFKLETKGVVTQKISPTHKGRVKFIEPVLGDSEWFAISDEEIDKGSTIKIVEINGQLIKVKKDQ